MRPTKFIICCALAALATGCAASRSDMRGAYHSDVPSGAQAQKVSAAFLFTHVRQTKGFDVIPKIDGQRQILSGFDDFFNDALGELTSVGSFATFTTYSSDVHDPARRAYRDSLVATHDYTVALRFSRETSFARRTLGTLGSTLTLTLAPVPYVKVYTLTAEVRDRAGSLLKRYERSARVTTWVEAFLIFVYPFHPEKRKTEEVYVAFLHDIFREIEADRILVAPQK